MAFSLVDWREKEKTSILCEPKQSNIRALKDIQSQELKGQFATDQTHEHFSWQPFAEWDDWFFHDSLDMVKNLAGYEEVHVARCPRILWSHIQ